MEVKAQQQLPERLRGGVSEAREGEGEGEGGEVGRGIMQDDQRNQPNLQWYEAKFNT